MPFDIRCLQQQRLKRTQAKLIELPDKQVHGILCAPPCTDFSGSGAQYWQKKDASGTTISSLSIVDACLRMVAIYKPTFWALENPVGRLRRWLGPYRFSFDPCDFAGWNSNPEADRYTKKTLLWGEFNTPEVRRQEPLKVCAQGSWLMKLGGKSERTKTLRSMTPLGFARAFFEANR
jgi:site-specific DNA-cytosine methylase